MKFSVGVIEQITILKKTRNAQNKTRRIIHSHQLDGWWVGQSLQRTESEVGQDLKINLFIILGERTEAKKKPLHSIKMKDTWMNGMELFMNQPPVKLASSWFHCSTV